MKTDLGTTLGPPVADALGEGWTVDAGWDPVGCGGVMIDGPAGARLHFYESWKQPGKVRAEGCYPQTDARHGRPGVYVTASRGVAVIAREIRGRLLPGYLPDLARVLAHNAGETFEQGQRQVVADKVAGLFPGAHHRAEGYHGGYLNTVIHAPGGGSGHVTSSGAAGTLTLELRGVPTEVALRMLEVLAGS
jgi:hypothetical protein